MNKYTMIALLLGLIFGSKASASDLPDFPFVHSEGTAVTNIQPDTAVITLTIENHSETASNAVAVVEVTGRQMIATLREKYGIQASSITAKNLNKSPVYRRGENYERLEIIGYEVNRTISIEIGEIESFAGAMHMIASLDHVTGINADFTHTEKEAISLSLTAIACRKAKSNAELLAGASDVQLGGLFAISTDGFSYVAERFKPSVGSGIMMSDNSLYGDIIKVGELSDPFFVPDTIEYEATVATIYKLK